MFTHILTSLFGSRNEKLLNSFREVVSSVNALREQMTKLDDAALQRKTAEFRQRLDNGETLEALMPEAFAVVREAAGRTVNMTHFDVQIIGGCALHKGKIAEMRTGEGKTLVATLPAYLNALSGHGTHVITVNDYLARRDAEWMGNIYRFLGIEIGVILPNLSPQERRHAYHADITYGTNNEFGFDYLRDNMARQPGNRVQRELNYAIIDEVDCILIDEARTPLIISGASDENISMYREVNVLVQQLESDDFTVDEKVKTAHLTEQGQGRVEKLLAERGLISDSDSLYLPANMRFMHYVDASLRAWHLYKKNDDYIVTPDGQVVIIDKFTGRSMPGRRWSDGLHQAVEAKEQMEIHRENQTLATITFQNYFRLYNKLAGMTGTADTEAYELSHVYGLEVMIIPTHQQMVRKDFGDVVYLTEQEKYEAILEDVRECQDQGRPVLVGTTSIDTSEYISALLKKEGRVHSVLNAKQHEREAAIIAQAGQPGTITIATNMAGRGTDIILGGNPEAEMPEDISPADRLQATEQWRQRYEAVVSSGGLHIIGTERHESRRIDNQLRGRSGRQGDPGSSRFYLSLEDNLMRIFAAERMAALMRKLGMQKGEVIEHPWVTRAIENAQKKVEAHNFDIRKHLLEYDNVANEQRRIVYAKRNEIMEMEDVSPIIDAMREDVVSDMIETHVPSGNLSETWDLDGLEKVLSNKLTVNIQLTNWLHEHPEADAATLRRDVDEAIRRQTMMYEEDPAKKEMFNQIKRHILLDVLDYRWREHLQTLDHLRHSINLRAYAAKNPKQEFKREALMIFAEMLDLVKQDTASFISHARITPVDETAIPEDSESFIPGIDSVHATHNSEMDLLHPPAAGPSEERENPAKKKPEARPFVRAHRKTGRNQPCHCGSGLKYKHCHGRS